jgi:hypothetical protein
MKVWHKVSFPGGQTDYEQYSASFELETVDVDSKLLSGLNLLETMFAFDTLVAYQGLLFQYLKGFIDKKSLDLQTKRMFGMLTPKIEEAVKAILKNGDAPKEKKSSGRGTKKKAE